MRPRLTEFSVEHQVVEFVVASSVQSLMVRMRTTCGVRAYMRKRNPEAKQFPHSSTQLQDVLFKA